MAPIDLRGERKKSAHSGKFELDACGLWIALYRLPRCAEFKAGPNWLVAADILGFVLHVGRCTWLKTRTVERPMRRSFACGVAVPMISMSVVSPVSAQKGKRDEPPLPHIRWEGMIVVPLG